MISAFWLAHRATILIALCAVLVGGAGGFWIQLKLKESAFLEMAETSLKRQTELQEKADKALEGINNLSTVLGAANEKVNEATTQLVVLGTNLNAANAGLRKSTENITARLKAAETAGITSRSAGHLIALLRRSIDENERCTRENKGCASDFARCAADAGQCGIHRKGLFEGWPSFEDGDGVTPPKGAKPGSAHD